MIRRDDGDELFNRVNQWIMRQLSTYIHVMSLTEWELLTLLPIIPFKASWQTKRARTVICCEELLVRWLLMSPRGLLRRWLLVSPREAGAAY